MNSLLIVTRYMKVRPKKITTRTSQIDSISVVLGKIASLSMNISKLVRNQRRDIRKWFRTMPFHLRQVVWKMQQDTNTP